MKKFLKVFVVLLFVVGLAVPSFAAKSARKSGKKFDRIVAQVETLDVAAKTIVVKEEKTGASRTIKISAKAASELNVGDRVRIKLKAGTDESAGVRVLKGKPEADVQDPASVQGAPAAENSVTK